MSKRHGCASCKAHDLKVLKQIGKPEHERLEGGNVAIYTYFDCTVCQAEWTRANVRGDQGRVAFWRPLR